MGRIKIRVYGFDPGTKFGWCVMDDGIVVASGVWITHKSGRSHTGFRFRNARLCLFRLFREYPPTEGCLIAFESVQAAGFKSKSNLRIYTGMVVQIMEIAATFAIPVEQFREASPASLKVHATGNGKAEKAEMVAACLQEFGINCVTDDEADAVWCADHCKEDPCQKSTCTHEGKRTTPSTQRSKPKAPKRSTKKAKSSRTSTAAARTSSKAKPKRSTGRKKKAPKK